jgi:Fe(3+) dicitrate transport protein
VLDDPTQRINARNLGSAVALALHVQDQITFRRLRIVPGLRVEYINTFFDDREAGTRANANMLAVLPGIGAFYGITQNIGVLAGVHRGFSPRSPGQSGTVAPEYSISYEAGARAQWRTFFAEAIAFVSDYQNLTGECTFSSGCSDAQVGQQFNGGAVLVYGAEAMARYSHMFNVGVELRAQASYTLTLSQFQTDFQSDNPLWGDVVRGDALPYVPEHQASGTLGVGMKRWGVDVTIRVVSDMRDVASQGRIAQNALIPAYAVADLAAFFVLPGEVRLFTTLENMTNATYMVSRRPFGARPGKPITFMAGISYAL